MIYEPAARSADCVPKLLDDDEFDAIKKNTEKAQIKSPRAKKEYTLKWLVVFIVIKEVVK